MAISSSDSQKLVSENHSEMLRLFNRYRQDGRGLLSATAASACAGILPHMSKSSSARDFLNWVDAVVAALPEDRRRSDRAISLAVTGKPDTIRSIRRNLENGTQQGVSTETVRKFEAWFATTKTAGEQPFRAPVGGRTHRPPIFQEVIPVPDQESPLDRLGPNTLPVLGITMGGRSDKRGPDFWMNGEVVRYAPRPRSLEGRKDAFGLYVDGTSMEPKYAAGDMVVVEKRPPAPGDDVVIELNSTDPADEHDNPSFIKQFVGRRGSTITVRQFNPKKELTFDLKEIKNLFRVIPVKELMA